MASLCGSDYERKRALFLKAIRATWGLGGDAAVLEAFGDAGNIDRLWELPVEKFRADLRERARAALRSRAA